MSIASSITAAQGRVADCYTAISGKGGTLPATQNLANMPTAINSIPSGVTPTGTINITTNGTHNVTNYANANVKVVSTKYGVSIGDILADPDSSGNYYRFTGGSANAVFSGIKSFGPYNFYSSGMEYLFYNRSSLESVSFPDLESIICNSALQFFCCNSTLTSFSAPNLKTISSNTAFQYAFYNSGLSSIDFSSLEVISGSSVFDYAFVGNSFLTTANRLETVTFPALHTIGDKAFNFAFSQQTNLTSLSFPALTTASFGSSTNQFGNMLSGTGSTKTHTIHFPSNLESTIQVLAGYPNFGGTSGYVVLAFDLPATS